MTTYFMWFLSSLIFGIIGAWLFAYKRRSPFLGFAVGFMLNVLVLVLWKRFANKKKEAAKC